MQFKVNSGYTVGNVKISLENLQSDSVKVEAFVGNEGKCAQCMQPIKDGEDIIIIQDTKLKGGAATLDQQLQLVHIVSNDNPCAEDYFARIKDKYTVLPPVPEVPSTSDAQTITDNAQKP